MKTAITGRPPRLTNPFVYTGSLKGYPGLLNHWASPILPLTLAIGFILLVAQASAQPIYTVNYGNLNFLDANRVHKLGTRGETAGSKTLYRNVMTASNGDVIDCIVTTVSLTNAWFSLPTESCPNTIPFDYKDTSNCPPTTLRGNEDRFFSPTMEFNTGGGGIKFRFEFIKGGSYNDATHKGQTVILRNVMINSYDIDGTYNCNRPDPNTNQYNDMNGFNAAARSTPGSKIIPSYNSSNGMTRFLSASHCNILNIKDPSTRIRVEYDYLQEFEVEMGMTGWGRGFYMLDFGPGPYWTPQYLDGNVFDLNTNTDSYNNSAAFCTVPVKISSGSGNVTSVNNAINEYFIAFQSSEILDGNSEYLTTDINNTAAHIRLGSPFSGSQTFTVGGIVYRAEKSESGGLRTIRILRNDGNTMTAAQAETLLDAFSYFNSANTPGVRRFRVWFREGTTTSTFGYFDLYGGCMILKAKALDFSATRIGRDVRIEWRMEDLQNILGYSLERSTDGSNWKEVARFGLDNTSGGDRISHLDRPEINGLLQYRLVERYTDGRFAISPVRSVRFEDAVAKKNPYPNPVTDGILNIHLEREGSVSVLDLSMRRVWHGSLPAGHQRIDLGPLPKGVYVLKADGRTHRIVIR